MKTLELKTSALGIKILEQKTESIPKVKLDNPNTYVVKSELRSLLEDYHKLLKLSKKAGFKVVRPKHYTETASFKKPLTDAQVPDFLKKGTPQATTKPTKKKRVKL